MAGATLTTANALLKDYYLAPVQEQLNNEVLLLQRLEARDQEIYGKRAVVPLHTGRSGGIGARGEGIQLPSPGNQVYQQATFDLKYLYGRARVTGPSMKRMANDAGAFMDILKSELDGLRNDLKRDTARQVYGDGTGAIATAAAVTAQTVLTLQSAEPLRKGQLYVGMAVDIGTVASPTSITSNNVITAVTIGTPSITLTSAVTTAGGEGIRVAGSATSSLTYEIDAGLQALISTSANTIGGLSASTNPIWDNVRQNMAGTLTTDAMMQLFNQVRINGGEPSAIITSLGVQRAYFNQLVGNVRYSTPTRLAGGFEALDFNGLPVIADILAPFGKVFFLDEKAIKVFALGDWSFLNEDGNMLHWQNDYDAWDAVLYRYMNLGAVRRNTSGVLYGVTDTTGY